MAHTHSPRGPEMRDANISLVVWTGIAILIAIFVCIGIAVVQFRIEESLLPKRAADNPFVQEGRIPPEPRLQSFPAKDLEEFRSKQVGETSAYGWVDKEGGVARVPIDKAMDMVLKKGLPVRGTEAAKK